MKSRARLDHQRFREMSAANTKLINIVNGMQEIKLTQSESANGGIGKTSRLHCLNLKPKH